MMRQVARFLFGVLFLVTFFLYFLWKPDKALAEVTIQTNEGRAAWFWYDCSDLEPEGSDVADWVVNPDDDLATVLIDVHNGYPRYEINCRLFLANVGEIPFKVSDVKSVNPNPVGLSLSARLRLGDGGKTIEPCGFEPDWMQAPASLPSECVTAVDLWLRVEQLADEKMTYGYGVEVWLTEP